MKRIAIVLAALALGLGLAACEGDTDPATNITNLSARLNFTGHANSGPAYSYFEYWKTSTPGTKFRTQTRSWPGGAQGTFGETVTGLTPNTSYSFRACGGDQGDAVVCRTTRSFTTLAGTSLGFERQWGSEGQGNGQFDRPLGVVTDSAGNVFVADTDNDRIQKFSSSGAFITKWGSVGIGNGQFQQPEGIATDSARNVYIAETGNDRVQKFTSSGAFITKWGRSGSGEGEFLNPNAADTDSAGDVYVVDNLNSRIQKFTSSGAFIRKWGNFGAGDGQFNDPNGVATDAGNVYVADCQSGPAPRPSRIQKFTSSGAFITKWPTNGNCSGVATDSSGAVYVLGGTQIQKFTSSGVLITTFDIEDQEGGNPRDVALDPFGNVYVAYSLPHRIKKFRPTQ
jgi:hypothetical protein